MPSLGSSPSRARLSGTSAAEAAVRRSPTRLDCGVTAESVSPHARPRLLAQRTASNQNLAFTQYPRRKREVLPDFSYRAVDSSGIVEHEICPVFLVELAPAVAGL